MRFLGRILLAWTIAPVRPASRNSCRKALFKTTRAAGFSPNDTLDSPTTVWHLGNCCEIRRVPSIVASALRRSSSIPVEIGSTSGSNRMSSSFNPYLPTARSRMRVAIEIFRSAVRAIAFCLSSSMHPATTAAPYFFAKPTMRANFSSPSSRFTEFSTHRPPASFNPASMTAGLVLSSMSGAGRELTNRCTTSFISRTPSRPTKSTQTSSMCDPSTHLIAPCHGDQTVKIILLKQAS